MRDKNMSDKNMSDKNLKLDVDWVGHDESRQEVARVCVASAYRFTRSGGAPTITVDCSDLRSLEAEIHRLQAELEAIAEEARGHFGKTAGKTSSARSTARSTAAASAPPSSSHAKQDSWKQRVVRDVMSKEVVTLHRNDELFYAKQLMEVGHFRHLVVLDEQDQVAGVISRQDIHFGALAWSMGSSESMQAKALHTTTAKAIMRRDVLTTAPEASLAEAAKLMVDNKIGCLPVVEGARLVGILTEGDLLALMAA